MRGLWLCSHWRAKDRFFALRQFNVFQQKLVTTKILDGLVSKLDPGKFLITFPMKARIKVTYLIGHFIKSNILHLTQDFVLRIGAVPIDAIYDEDFIVDSTDPKDVARKYNRNEGLMMQIICQVGCSSLHFTHLSSLLYVWVRVSPYWP